MAPTYTSRSPVLIVALPMIAPSSPHRQPLLPFLVPAGSCATEEIRQFAAPLPSLGLSRNSEPQEGHARSALHRGSATVPVGYRASEAPWHTSFEMRDLGEIDSQLSGLEERVMAVLIGHGLVADETSTTYNSAMDSYRITNYGRTVLARFTDPEPEDENNL